MDILRDAPSLSGSKACPSCGKTIERDATLCVHCGYSYATGQRLKGHRPLQRLVAVSALGLVLAGGGLAYLFWPETEEAAVTDSMTQRPDDVADPVAESAVPSPSPTLAPEPVVQEPPPVESVTPIESEENGGTAETETSSASVDVPPAPTAEELVQQEAEAQQALFAERKAKAEQILRARMEQVEPMHKMGDAVELRRKNGIFHKGTLKRFVGQDDARVVVVATEHTGEVEIPLTALDSASRRRVDKNYREAYILHLLGTRLPPPPSQTSETAPAASEE